MIRATLLVYGKSLGMSYMSVVSSAARDLKINGKVKRMAGGLVTIICECNGDGELESFRRTITRNDSFAKVEKIDVVEKKEVQQPEFTWFYIDR